MRSTDISPIDKFALWFTKANREVKKDPNAMILSTCRDRQPNSRVVLMKSFNERGFVFYSNSESAKGRALEENNLCSLLFYWPELGRQVVICGPTRKIPPEESDMYFYSRSIISQYGAMVSNQSREIRNKMDLVKQVASMMLRGVKPKRPECWTGYIVDPISMEFWEEGAYRLHSREMYRWRPDGWKKTILAP